MSDYLQTLAASGTPSRWNWTPEEARDGFKAAQHIAGPPRVPIGPIQDLAVSVREGSVPARLYRPKEAGAEPVIGVPVPLRPE